jgi:hypothetical protein
MGQHQKHVEYLEADRRHREEVNRNRMRVKQVPGEQTIQSPEILNLWPVPHSPMESLRWVILKTYAPKRCDRGCVFLCFYGCLIPLVWPGKIQRYVLKLNAKSTFGRILFGDGCRPLERE